MKPQDIVFFIVIVTMLIVKKQSIFLWAGLACLVCAMPLFATWVFFTAERLTWYAAAFFLLYLLGFFFRSDTVK